MAELNKDNLENALNAPRVGEENVPSLEDKGKAPQKQEGNSGSDASQNNGQVSNEEEIGFHKGALNTLVNERNELLKMIQNVESVMQAHIKRLEQLGVKVPVQGQGKQ